MPLAVFLLFVLMLVVLTTEPMQDDLRAPTLIVRSTPMWRRILPARSLALLFGEGLASRRSRGSVRRVLCMLFGATLSGRLEKQTG